MYNRKYVRKLRLGLKKYNVQLLFYKNISYGHVFIYDLAVIRTGILRYGSYVSGYEHFISYKAFPYRRPGCCHRISYICQNLHKIHPKGYCVTCKRIRPYESRPCCNIILMYGNNLGAVRKVRPLRSNIVIITIFALKISSKCAVSYYLMLS